jgi:hypothetical protein
MNVDSCEMLKEMLIGNFKFLRTDQSALYKTRKDNDTRNGLIALSCGNLI